MFGAAGQWRERGRICPSGTNFAETCRKPRSLREDGRFFGKKGGSARPVRVRAARGGRSVRARAAAGEKNVDAAVDGALSRGLAAWDADGRLVPTERGWLLGNELYGLMWDLAADD